MIEHNGETYKIVVVTPAGREKYLSFFKNYIYAEMDRGLVDGWQLWQNTVKESDIAYLASMEAENPKVKRFFIEDLKDKYNYCDTWRTHEFFLNCFEDDTIYIRFDDDIVWYEPGVIEKIARARIEHPLALAIYPNVINSTTCTSWHQKSGVLSTAAGVVKQAEDKPEDPNWAYLDDFNYTNSALIDHMHNTFKENYAAGTLSRYYLPSRSLDTFTRFSICSIAWFGKDKIGPGNSEEAQMSWELPAGMNRPIYFVGDALMVHYAYHTQRDYLESCQPEQLEFYKKIAEDYFLSRHV